MASCSDFRLQSLFFRHPKTRRLRNHLGPEAVLSLLTLWGWAAEFRPTGDLSGMTQTEIAQAAEWSGGCNCYDDRPTGCSAFVDALVSIGWLDRNGETFSLHDWADWQPWVVGAPERSKAAKRAGKASGKSRSVNNIERNANGALTGRSDSVRNPFPGSNERIANGTRTPSPIPDPIPDPDPTPPPTPPTHHTPSATAPGGEGEGEGRFARFRAAWFGRQRRWEHARRIFDALTPDDQAAILDALPVQAKWPDAPNRMDPDTWLRDRRWTDEPPLPDVEFTPPLPPPPPVEDLTTREGPVGELARAWAAVHQDIRPEMFFRVLDLAAQRAGGLNGSSIGEAFESFLRSGAEVTPERWMAFLRARRSDQEARV